jgi:two-component system, NarL family, response regulator NreC
MWPAMKQLRILLADDHQIVREGLKLLLGGQPDMLVVGEAENGKQALEKSRQLKPHVIVMDLSMPELNGLQATQRLKAEQPNVKVVALTIHDDQSYLRQLCAAGAAGYVLKRSTGEDLIEAIRTVAAGRLHFDAALAGEALATQLTEPNARGETRGGAELSEREKEVLILLAWGYGNKEIASELDLSIKTVETYKVRIGEKIGARSRTEMVQHALRQGWLSETYSFLRGVK